MGIIALTFWLLAGFLVERIISYYAQSQDLFDRLCGVFFILCGPIGLLLIPFFDTSTAKSRTDEDTDEIDLSNL